MRQPSPTPIQSIAPRSGRIKLASLHLPRDESRGLDEFGPASVAEGEDEGEAVVLGQRGLGLLQLFLDELRQTPDLADGFEADVVLV